MKAANSSGTQDTSDPFGSSFTAAFSTNSPTTDPFHNNNNNNKFSSSGGNDPFSLTNLRPPPAVPDTNGKDRVASTTSTVSYRKEKVSTESSDSSTSKVKKKTSHSLSDFLTGSPLKTADKDKDKVKEKKEKKHGKFHISSPLKAHKSKSGESPKSGSKSSASSDNGVDEVSVCWLQHTKPWVALWSLILFSLHQGVKERFGKDGTLLSVNENVWKGHILVLQIAQLAHEAVAVARILCSNSDKRSEQTDSYLRHSSTLVSPNLPEPEYEQPRPKLPPAKPKLPPTRPKSTPPDTNQQLSRPISPLVFF